MALLKCKICGEEFTVSGKISSVSCGNCGAEQTVTVSDESGDGRGKSENNCDVFVSCKEYDEHGQKTVDSIIARNICDSLASKGITVFFSGDQTASQNNDGVLSGAKVMVLIVTKKEYFYDIRIENEWSQFIKTAEKDNKTLITCGKDLYVGDVPEQIIPFGLRNVSDTDFMKELTEDILKAVRDDAPAYSEPENSQPRSRTPSNPMPVMFQNKPEKVKYVGNKQIDIKLYLILCFFLGTFGVHSFYAKKPLEGLLHILLCATGISTLWAVVEFFKALFSKKVV